MSAPSTSPASHGSSSGKGTPRWIFDGIKDTAGIGRNDNRNTHHHFHAEVHNRDEVAAATTALATLASRTLEQAPDAVNVELEEYGPPVLQDLRNAITTWLHAVATLGAGDDSEMLNARNELTTALLVIRDDTDLIWTTGPARDAGNTISQAANELLNTLNTDCFDAYGVVRLDGSRLPAAQRRLSTTLNREVARVQNLVQNGRNAPTGRPNVIVADSDDGRAFIDFRDGMTVVLNDIFTSPFWNNVPAIPGSDRVLPAATTAIAACRNLVTPRGDNIEIGNITALQAALQDLQNVMSANLNTAPHGVVIAAEAQRYRMFKKVRNAIALILGMTATGDSSLNNGNIMKAPFRYTTGYSVAGDYAVNRYGNWSYEDIIAELEKDKAEFQSNRLVNAAEDGYLKDLSLVDLEKKKTEFIKGRKLEDMKSGEVKLVAAFDKIITAKKAEVEKAKNNAVKKADEKKSGEKEKSSDAAVLETPKAPLGFNYEARRKGNSIIVTVPAGHAPKVNFGIWLGKPGEGSKDFTDTLSKVSDTEYTLSLPEDIAGAAEAGVVVEVPENGASWTSTKFGTPVKFKKP